MTKTVTFMIGGVYAVVKESFVKKYGNPINLGGWYELNNNYNLVNYLHNTEGPAMYSHGSADGSGAFEQFWIDGKYITDPTEVRRITFNEALDKLLED